MLVGNNVIFRLPRYPALDASFEGIYFINTSVMLNIEQARIYHMPHINSFNSHNNSMT